ncbi:carbamoyltransferase HypF [Azotosporobacter soli]|uniref:carbamoyltransferase HypF n=1 Tax=Azotosporobacter soli TaxID=3055040 RepID=UPI0031FEBC46
MPRLQICISGIVQGVGFRPFVYRLACAHRLSGWVRNDNHGVEIEVQGRKADLSLFLHALQEEAPPAALIGELQQFYREEIEEEDFVILPSQAKRAGRAWVAADLATCSDCLRELRDPSERRHRYPFLNCTQCGPRYSIIRQMPYDRPHTSLADFTLCPDCKKEYENTADRRFHAQPIACPKCGPSYWLEREDGSRSEGKAAIEAARQLIAAGGILAIKGIGGCHLACDARQEDAVSKLRRRKKRLLKPFALMAGSLETARELCRVSQQEEEALSGPARPIVLLERQESVLVAEGVAPGQRRLGVMLPYTPLHALLLEKEDVWVMTSGNDADAPMLYRDAEMRSGLLGLADAWLLNDRPIVRPIDDSVLQIVAARVCMIRRSRGFAPQPLPCLPATQTILAAGGDLKNTFCLADEGMAFLSGHMGDLAEASAQENYRQQQEELQKLLDCSPTAVVYDLHPAYHSQRLFRKTLLPSLSIQHHHAHAASVLAEHRLTGPALGVVLDGTGYGTDGSLWGSEFLALSGASFKRLAHFSYLPLPGGEQAVRQPWRLAAWILSELYGDNPVAWPIQLELPEGWPVLRQAVRQGLASVPACGAGRWFDAAAVILGLGRENQYEGHLAGLLTEAVQGEGELLHYAILPGTPRQIDLLPLLKDLAEGVLAGKETAHLAASFHLTLFQALREMLLLLRVETGLNTLLLSGGVWQNRHLLARALLCLPEDGFAVYCNQQVPANDGGLSLGQAWIAASRLKEEESCV